MGDTSLAGRGLKSCEFVISNEGQDDCEYSGTGEDLHWSAVQVSEMTQRSAEPVSVQDTRRSATTAAIGPQPLTKDQRSLHASHLYEHVICPTSKDGRF